MAARQGSFAGAITCPLHGLSYRYDGAASGATPGSGLEPLAVAERGNCLYIRPVSAGAGVIGGQSEPPPDVNATAFESAACPCERAVAADWKVLIELWLAEPPPAGLTALRPDMRTGWTRARLAALGETRDPPAAARLFLAPNQFLESGADSLRVVQVVPDAPGRCRVRHFEYTPVGGERAASARAYLERRLARRRLAADCELAESIQRGLATQGAAAPLPGGPAALSEFRQALARLLPSALV